MNHPKIALVESYAMESISLKKEILPLFEGIPIQQEKEYSYRLDQYVYQQIALAKEYICRRVTKKFLDSKNIQKFSNPEFLLQRIRESWKSMEQFERNGLAFCITKENRIVAVIVGTARYQNVIPINIETLESERSKGFAYYMANEFIQYALDHGITPQWDCVESNPVSMHLAEKLKFQKIHENDVYWFNIP